MLSLGTSMGAAFRRLRYAPTRRRAFPKRYGRRGGKGVRSYRRRRVGRAYGNGLSRYRRPYRRGTPTRRR